MWKVYKNIEKFVFLFVFLKVFFSFGVLKFTFLYNISIYWKSEFNNI